MATINPTVVDQSGDGTVLVITWETLTTTNADGAPFARPAWSDKCVQIKGTFGAGGTVKLQGSNDGANWVDLTDAQGNAISKTAAALEQVGENPLYVRPFISAGDGTTDIDVVLVARRANLARG